MSVYDSQIRKVETDLEELRTQWKAATTAMEKGHIYKQAQERTRWLEKLRQARAKLELSI